MDIHIRFWDSENILVKTRYIFWFPVHVSCKPPRQLRTCMLSILQKRRFLKTSDNIALGFVLCNVVWSLSCAWATSMGFLHVQCCPVVLRKHWTGFFPVECCLEFLGQHWTTLHKAFTCAMLSQEYKDNIECWTGFFPLHYCLEPLGQHCTRFLPVQCCLKSIDTTLCSNFTCAVLSGASRRTLHWVFTCELLAHG